MAGNSNSGKNMVVERAQAAEMLAAGGVTCKQIADQLGVCANTVSNWRKDPKFMEDVVERSRCKLQESVPHIYKILYSCDDEVLSLVLAFLTNLECCNKASSLQLLKGKEILSEADILLRAYKRMKMKAEKQLRETKKYTNEKEQMKEIYFQFLKEVKSKGHKPGRAFFLFRDYFKMTDEAAGPLVKEFRKEL